MFNIHMFCIYFCWSYCAGRLFALCYKDSIWWPLLIACMLSGTYASFMTKHWHKELIKQSVSERLEQIVVEEQERLGTMERIPLLNPGDMP